jgi:RNA polymerase sigma-70 factor (ECF subfamily)
MTSAEAFEFRSAGWDADQVEHTANSRLVLELYDREQVSLRRYLVCLGLDPATAEETVQESFLRLHQHLLANGDRAHLRGWLYRVAHNVARNIQLSYGASRTRTLADLTLHSEPSAGTASAEEALLEREKEKRLQRAMDQLSEAQRNCLVLRSQGLKYREIAETLNLSISTVAENVQRGLERLKETV